MGVVISGESWKSVVQVEVQGEGNGRPASPGLPPEAMASVIPLERARRNRSALQRWHRVHERMESARGHRGLNEASQWAVELYGFKQRQALDLLLDLGWQHERFYALHEVSAEWSALAEEVMDAMECAASLFELQPGSLAGEKLLAALVQRVPVLHRLLEALESGQEERRHR